jgi:hypothetical protein
VSTLMQNNRGEWVPAIPQPMHTLLGCRCGQCGKRSWTKDGYRGHYALAHILGVQKVRT